MSEASEKVHGVRTLPIFPLPVVLLPGEVIPLHIFEQRYRDMIADVEAGNRLFGLSYFGVDDPTPVKPGLGHLGCAAEIREIETMPDGRSNIVIGGVIRYRMEDYVDSEASYLVGDVSFFEDIPVDESETEKLNALAKEVTELFTRVANAAHRISGERSPLPDLPDIDAERLSYLISAAFNFEDHVKFELMETRSTEVRLEKLRVVLKQAAVKIEETENIHKVSKTNGHSKKPIDLDQ